MTYWSRTSRISRGLGRCERAACAFSSSSSRMMSLHSSTHSSQMNTLGPAMSLRTSCWLLPQKEQYRILLLSPERLRSSVIASWPPPRRAHCGFDSRITQRVQRPPAGWRKAGGRPEWGSGRRSTRLDGLVQATVEHRVHDAVGPGLLGVHEVVALDV